VGAALVLRANQYRLRDPLSGRHRQVIISTSVTVARGQLADVLRSVADELESRVDGF